MPAARADVERLLEHVLGFQREESDHHRFRLYVSGRLVAMTKTSHSHRTIGDPLLAEMARQMHVTLPLLRALVAGTKGRDDYLDALRGRGLLSE